MTLGIDLGHIRTLLAYGAAVHGLPYSQKDWKMLQRYTHIRPQDLHALGARRRAARQVNSL
jgi:hypothetical protein